MEYSTKMTSSVTVQKYESVWQPICRTYLQGTELEFIFRPIYPKVFQVTRQITEISRSDSGSWSRPWTKIPLQSRPLTVNFEKMIWEFRLWFQFSNLEAKPKSCLKSTSSKWIQEDCKRGRVYFSQKGASWHFRPNLVVIFNLTFCEFQISEASFRSQYRNFDQIGMIVHLHRSEQ